jgi:hypothetical protein
MEMKLVLIAEEVIVLLVISLIRRAELMVQIFYMVPIQFIALAPEILLKPLFRLAAH